MWKISERINKETRSERKHPGNLREKIDERKISEKKNSRKPDSSLAACGVAWESDLLAAGGDVAAELRPERRRRVGGVEGVPGLAVGRRWPDGLMDSEGAPRRG